MVIVMRSAEHTVEAATGMSASRWLSGGAIIWINLELAVQPHMLVSQAESTPVQTRIPYENAVAGREDLIRIYNRNVAAGTTPPAEIDGQHFKSVFSDFLGEGTPRSGWTHIALELRLIELGCGSFDFPVRTFAEVRRETAALISVLRKAAIKAEVLFRDPAFLAGIDEEEHRFAFQDDSELLGKMVDDLEAVGSTLARLSDPPRWSAGQARRKRLKLAALLAPIFEDQFKQVPKPVGGSAPLPDGEVNDWTRFFQIAATIFWNERVTPDRQAVLWEATRPPAWPSDYSRKN